ncbi:uncharacterized protein RSE6_10678 [Rhynchosporium secalis]|uniref:Uncharacterized protein n=1 Tax=Rhynchosporium secalis TaxID=38038 RepID=A0A1E1ML40_RHYSE|nr:uncharacterized protein RSE6_10678 [Rhynchosporium secalis]
MTHTIYVEILKEHIKARYDFVLEEDGDSGYGYGSRNNPVTKWKREYSLKSYKNSISSLDLSPAENG